eukprot:scaffold109881_cov48-Phaeocystis_antarctica.AAC.1
MRGVCGAVRCARTCRVLFATACAVTCHRLRHRLGRLLRLASPDGLEQCGHLTRARLLELPAGGQY